MNVKNFVLSYYKNSIENFHIQKLDKVTEAQKPHTHEYFQIYFIAKGSLEHYVENEFAHLNQGDMFIIPPGLTHYISPSSNTVFYSLSFMEGLLKKFGFKRYQKFPLHDVSIDEVDKAVKQMHVTGDYIQKGMQKAPMRKSGRGGRR